MYVFVTAGAVEVMVASMTSVGDFFFEQDMLININTSMDKIAAVFFTLQLPDIVFYAHVFVIIKNISYRGEFSSRNFRNPGDCSPYFYGSRGACPHTAA